MLESSGFSFALKRARAASRSAPSTVSLATSFQSCSPAQPFSFIALSASSAEFSATPTLNRLLVTPTSAPHFERPVLRATKTTAMFLSPNDIGGDYRGGATSRSTRLGEP